MWDQTGREANGGSARILSREIFLNFLDMEVKRARRYQNFFCILVMKLTQVSNHDNGTHQTACYQKLTHLLKEELRESDILGTLSDDCLAALLPYGDASAGDSTRSRFEGCVGCYDFKSDGYEVKVDQVCFPADGTDTPEIIKKVKSIGEA